MSLDVSIFDVAREAGVSISTVSRVVNGRTLGVRIGPATRARVLAVARQLNYQPSQIARNVATGKGAPPRPPSTHANPPPCLPAEKAAPDGRQIGLILALASPATTLDLIPNLVRVLAAADYRLDIVPLPPDPVAAHARIAQLLCNGVVGVLCCPTLQPTVSAAVAGTRPVIVLSTGAGQAMLMTLNPPPAITVLPGPPPEVRPAPAPAPVIPPKPSIVVPAAMPVVVPDAVPIPIPVPVSCDPPAPPVIPQQPEPVIVATSPTPPAVIPMQDVASSPPPAPEPIVVPAPIVVPEAIVVPEPLPVVTPEPASEVVPVMEPNPPQMEPQPEPSPDIEPSPPPAEPVAEEVPTEPEQPAAPVAALEPTAPPPTELQPEPVIETAPMVELVVPEPVIVMEPVIETAPVVQTEPIVDSEPGVMETTPQQAAPVVLPEPTPPDPSQADQQPPSV